MSEAWTERADTEAAILRATGWSWRELMETPGDVVDAWIRQATPGPERE